LKSLTHCSPAMSKLMKAMDRMGERSKVYKEQA